MRWDTGPNGRGTEYDNSLVRKCFVEIPNERAQALMACLFVISFFHQSFTRLTELVLQAHKKNIENLLGSVDDYLDMATLEEEKDSQDADATTQKTCSC